MNLSFIKNLHFDGAIKLDDFLGRDQKLVQRISESYRFLTPQDLTSDQANKSSSEALKLILNFLADTNEKFGLIKGGYGSGKSHFGMTLSSLVSARGDISTLLNLLEERAAFSPEDLRLINELKPYIVIPVGMIAKPDHSPLKQRLLESILHYDVAIEEELESHKEVWRDLAFRIQGQRSSEPEKIENLFDEGKMNIDLDSLLNLLMNGDFAKHHDLFHGVLKLSKEELGYNPIIPALDLKVILNAIGSKYCGPGKKYQGILILWDEFGDFVSSAAKSSSFHIRDFQTDYEAIQDCDFAKFIGISQFNLKEYYSLQSVYTDYEEFDKYFRFQNINTTWSIESNLEAVLSNLIENSNLSNTGLKPRFEEIKEFLVQSPGNQKCHRFLRDGSEIQFQTTFTDNLYPFHPLSSLLLFKSSDWCQSRTASILLANCIEAKTAKDGSEFILPHEVFAAGLLDEFKQAIDEGRIHYLDENSSKVAIHYQDALNHKHLKEVDEGTRCAAEEILGAVLAAYALNLVVPEGQRYFELCTNLDESLIRLTLNSMIEEKIIEYVHEDARYKFVSSQISTKEFLDIFRNKVKEYGFDPDHSNHFLSQNKLLKTLGLDSPIRTPFSIRKGIKSEEWVYDSKIVTYMGKKPDPQLKNYIGVLKKLFDYSSDNEWSCARGMVVFLLFDSEGKIEEFCNQHFSKCFQEAGMGLPLVCVCLTDNQLQFFKLARDLYILNRFSEEELIRCGLQHFEMRQEILKGISNSWKSLLSNARVFTSESERPIIGYSNSVLEQTFESIYSKTPSFYFDFLDTDAKVVLDIGMEIIQNKDIKKLVQNKEGDPFRRISTCFTDYGGWGVCTEQLEFKSSTSELPENIQEIFTLISDTLLSSEGGSNVTMLDAYRRLVAPPYGMNSLSIFLMILVWYRFQGSKIEAMISHQKIAAGEYLELKLHSDNKILVSRKGNIPSDQFFRAVSFRQVEKEEILRAKYIDLQEETSLILAIEQLESTVGKCVDPVLIEGFQNLLNEREVLQKSRLEVQNSIEQLENAFNEFINLVKQIEFDKFVNFLKHLYASQSQELFRETQRLESLNLLEKLKSTNITLYQEYLDLQNEVVLKKRDLINLISKKLPNISELFLHEFESFEDLSTYQSQLQDLTRWLCVLNTGTDEHALINSTEVEHCKISSLLESINSIEKFLNYTRINSLSKLVDLRKINQIAAEYIQNSGTIKVRNSSLAAGLEKIKEDSTSQIREITDLLPKLKKSCKVLNNFEESSVSEFETLIGQLEQRDPDRLNDEEFIEIKDYSKLARAVVSVKDSELLNWFNQDPDNAVSRLSELSDLSCFEDLSTYRFNEKMIAKAQNLKAATEKESEEKRKRWMDRLNGADVKLETLDALNRFLIQNEDLPDYLTEQEKSGADEKLKQLALRKITLKSKEWTDQTMSQNIHELSPSDLANLNHKLAACLQSPPEYITEDDLSKVSVQREEVQQLITKHKVTLLIDDYKTLEPNAREDFIHQLKLLRQSEEKSHEF